MDDDDNYESTERRTDGRCGIQMVVDSVYLYFGLSRSFTPSPSFCMSFCVCLCPCISMSLSVPGCVTVSECFPLPMLSVTKQVSRERGVEYHMR